MSQLADDLERLCCAETEGKFFDLVTDSIDQIIRALRAVEVLQTENWQLKGALGYPVPGHIMPGPFKCGMCEARAKQTIG